MARVWFQLRVRRADQPSVAPNYTVIAFSYRAADVIEVPRTITSRSDEPVLGKVIAELVKPDGAVEAKVVVRDADLKVIVQLFGWSSDGTDDPATPQDDRWVLLETVDDKTGTISIAGKFPKATLGGSQ